MNNNNNNNNHSGGSLIGLEYGMQRQMSNEVVMDMSF
jgi:hypothetical protein